MTDPQDETLENQTPQPEQPDTTDSPTAPVNAQSLEEPLEDRENEVVEENEPVPTQFQSPYFPDGVYEDAQRPEIEGISYDPFATQTEAKQEPDKAPKRKVWITLGAVLLVLIAALVYGFATGRLVLPF